MYCSDTNKWQLKHVNFDTSRLKDSFWEYEEINEGQSRGIRDICEPHSAGWISALAHLAEFLPKMPTLKTVRKLQASCFTSKTHREFCPTIIITSFIFLEKMGEWLHHDLMTQLGAGGMLRVCRYCVAVKISNFSQVRIAVDHDFFFFSLRCQQWGPFVCGETGTANDQPWWVW